MSKDLSKHLYLYIGISLGLIIVLSLFYIFRYDRFALKIISGTSVLSYVSLGIIHHAIEERLNKLIAIEYISYGLITLLLLLTVLSF